jgi:hypothetical protein
MPAGATHLCQNRARRGDYVEEEAGATVQDKSQGGVGGGKTRRRIRTRTRDATEVGAGHGRATHASVQVPIDTWTANSAGRCARARGKDVVRQHHRAHGCRATGQADSRASAGLDALRSAGAISEAEHAAKRGQIIDEI